MKNYERVNELQASLGRIQKRHLEASSTLVTLTGASCVGKSSLLAILDSGPYEAIPTFTTRPARPGDSQRVHVEPDKFKELAATGQLVNADTFYGARYGIALASIEDPLGRGITPAVQMGLPNIRKLDHPDFSILNVYIRPEDTDSWQARLTDSDRFTPERLQEGLRELGSLALTNFEHDDIDFSIINEIGKLQETAVLLDESIQAVLHSN